MHSLLFPYVFNNWTPGPSVYVVSEDELAEFKRRNIRAEITELNLLIDSHKRSIERLENTVETLRKDIAQDEATA